MTAPRSVGLLGATGIGVGSMLGAGVFVVWGPALAAAGELVVLAVALAGAVATVNALSSAQLAARYPKAGGAYSYGRAEIGPTWGFVAGVAFVAGKTASVAAIALAVGHYVWGAHPAVVATVAIVASWVLNARGVARTAAVATAVSGVVLVVLAGLMVAVLRGRSPDAHGLASVDLGEPSRVGVLSAAALIFFAFAGYARVATLGEEVRKPTRTIPLAIVLSLIAVGALYFLIAQTFRLAWEGEPLDAEDVALRALASQVHLGGAIVSVVAPVAAMGALVALMAGVGRTGMAMARNADLPVLLAKQGAAGVPWIAEGVSAAAAIVLTWSGGLTFALAMSACCVLVYYAVANLAAARQALGRRTASWRVPPAVSAMGAVLCVALAVSLPLAAIAAAVTALAGAVLARAASRRRLR